MNAYSSIPFLNTLPRGLFVATFCLFAQSVLGVTVNCGAGEKISDALAPGVLINIIGVCQEDVVITQDDVTLTWNGAPNPKLRSTNKATRDAIVVNGARRVTLDRLVIVNSRSGVVVTNGAAVVLTRSLITQNREDGIVVTDNATLTVEKSNISSNGFDGIKVTNGSVTTISNNTISKNGDALIAPPHAGVGVEVLNNSTAGIIRNKIEDNLADGIGVYSGSFARVEENTIQGNGLTGSSCGNIGGCGIQLSRSRVVAGGNVIKNNGYGALAVWNHSVYRTGTYLTLASDRGNADNLFPFEVIEQGIGSNAVEAGRNSLADLRQVNIQGTVNVSDAAFVQVRGDNVGPSTQCSVLNGDVNVQGNFSVASFGFTNVTGVVSVDAGSAVQGSTVCP